jgi:conjugal transfer pilus assembly protein TraB
VSQKLKNLLGIGVDENQSASNQNTGSLNSKMRKKQTLYGVIVLSIFLVLGLVLHGLAAKETSAPIKKSTQAEGPDGILSTDFTEKESLSALESEQQEINRLTEHLEELSKKTAAIEKSAHDAQKNDSQADSTPLMSASSPLLKRLEKPLQAQNNQAMGAPPLSNTSETPEYSALQNPSSSMTTLHFDYPKQPQKSATRVPPEVFAPNDANELSQHVTLSTNNKNPKTYVPAGTFVRGVLLEGADANASVNGQSDTVPILVRLLDSGTLPNGGVSHLKGCFVLASIYGDISSERGEARLDTLSCTRKNGSIFEVPVQGHLSFAGKEGIKGTPIMRNGKILTMAGISGALSGFGSALQQTTQTISTSSLGSVATVQGNQIWASGAYGGASTAMGQLAHYYIERAEQYHPIISIGSGTVATVIFQRGFYLKDKEEELNQAGSFESSDNSSSHKADTDEIKALLSESKKLEPHHDL